MPHLLYSPNLDPSDLFVYLFPRMKKVLKEKCFADVEDMKQKMAKAQKYIKINEFKNCFEQWKTVNRCITSNNGYFESD